MFFEAGVCRVANPWTRNGKGGDRVLLPGPLRPRGLRLCSARAGKRVLPFWRGEDGIPAAAGRGARFTPSSALSARTTRVDLPRRKFAGGPAAGDVGTASAGSFRFSGPCEAAGGYAMGSARHLAANGQLTLLQKASMNRGRSLR